MANRDYIIAHASMGERAASSGVRGEYCEKLGGVRRRAMANPLHCRPHQLSRGMPSWPVAEDTRAAERAAILSSIPDNDSEIFPRIRNGGGDHAYLRQFTSALQFWRRMQNPPAELGTWAANDNEPEAGIEYVKGGNPAPLSAESWLALLPVPVRVSVTVVRNRPCITGRSVARYHWHPSDIDHVPAPGGLQRVARLGGFEFSTVDNAVATDKLRAQSITKKGRPRSVLVPLGSIVAITRGGRRAVIGQDSGRSRPEENEDALLAAKQSREFYKLALAGPHGLPGEPRKPRALSAPRTVLPNVPVTGTTPEVTYCPPGLPYGVSDLSKLFSGIGSTRAGQKTAVRRPVDVGRAIWDVKGDETAITRFRAHNDNHAKVLDACMVASNLTDIAAVFGKASPHTGRAKLLAACRALKDFLDKNAA